MSRKFNIILSLLFIITLSLCASDDLRKKMFFLCKAELPDNDTKKTFLAAELPVEMYDWVNRSYTDLRILDKEGHQVPYAIRPVMGKV